MDFQYEPGRIYLLRENRLIAEITFPAVHGVADINHTFVDDSLRGQGIASELVQRAAAQIRAEGIKTRTSCSYAASWFAKHPEQQDLLAAD